MTGQEYLEAIRANLESGRHQHRMGQNVLRAFGYVRRRSTAIQQINDKLNELDLIADPPIDSRHATTEPPASGSHSSHWTEKPQSKRPIHQS